MESQPTWVKVAQNGAIGEARTRSFLLDRFWILERSIDIHGADFIIQRRLTNRNILDRNAPKLGVVQAKFISTSSTSHYIHCEYVVDKQGLPRDEFFLIIHTGNEENPLMYFLTAKEIDEHFKKVIHNRDEKFHISGRIIKDDRFKVTSRREILDKIETQLIKADFAKNREYLSWTLASSEISLDDILPEFNMPIDNYWGDIPEAFYETKKNAAKALIEVENVCFILKSIASETDPIKAAEYLDDFRYYCRGGLNWYISLPDNIYNEEFIDVIQRHKEIVQKLKDHNLLDEYLISQKQIEHDFIEFLCDELPFDSKLTHKATIVFDNVSLKIESINNNLIETPSNNKEYSDRVRVHRNKLEYYWKPLGITYGTKRFDEDSEGIKNNCKYVSSECMRYIVNKSLGTDY
ncbi:MAG: hypothetical protein HWN69_01620 [Desulfobacterales bacterium]|nr:hypothetical protein [Desulfobacterales bacterium]